MAGSKVLVFGGTGPAGICLLRELLHRNHQTLAYARNTAKIPNDLKENPLLEASWTPALPNAHISQAGGKRHPGAVYMHLRIFYMGRLRFADSHLRTAFFVIAIRNIICAANRWCRYASGDLPAELLYRGCCSMRRLPVRQ